MICLNQNYSTSRFLIMERPEIVNEPQYKIRKILFLPINGRHKEEGGLRIKGYFKKSIQSKPLVTIITVVLNGEDYLEQTIKSVINQTYDNIEYIVIDGGSRDKTKDIIKLYDSVIDYWVSEEDKGISDAFNKGISLATGEIIGILNASDWYENDAVETIVLSLKKGGYFWFCGCL